jgi:hypothetical protein
MPAAAKASVEHRLEFLRDSAVRIGIHAGVGLSLIFIAWIVVANRLPRLETIATERNIVTAALLAFFSALPVIRFVRSPAELLVSGLLAWGIFTVTYRVLCSIFVLLQENYSAFHVFVLGAISYLVFATLSWIGTIVWRVRATNSSHQAHR